MGGFLVNAFVRHTDQASVVTATAGTLAALSSSIGSPPGIPREMESFLEGLSDAGEGPGLLQAALGVGNAAGSYPLAYVSPAITGWVGVFPTGADPSTLARSLSERLQTVVISFEIHDGDFLRYWLARNGEMVDQYHSAPDYFGEPVSAAQRRRLRGNAAVLADTCGNPDAGEALAALLADPPGDAFGLLEDLGAALHIPGVQFPGRPEPADPGIAAPALRARSPDSPWLPPELGVHLPRSARPGPRHLHPVSRSARSVGVPAGLARHQRLQ